MMKKLLASILCSVLVMVAALAQAQTPASPSGVNPPMPRSEHDPMNAPPSERDIEMQQRDQEHLERNDGIKKQDDMRKDDKDPYQQPSSSTG